jgi:hypothetical protein
MDGYGQRNAALICSALSRMVMLSFVMGQPTNQHCDLCVCLCLSMYVSVWSSAYPYRTKESVCQSVFNQQNETEEWLTDEKKGIRMQFFVTKLRSWRDKG